MLNPKTGLGQNKRKWFWYRQQNSHLALEMTANLCGENPEFWAEAERATVASLERRIELCNGAHKRILEGVGM